VSLVLGMKMQQMPCPNNGVPTTVTDTTYLEHMCACSNAHSIPCTAAAAEVGIITACTYPSLLNTWASRRLTENGFHVC